MSRSLFLALCLLALPVCSGPLGAGTVSVGGDVIVGGSDAGAAPASGRDLIAAGASVRMRGAVAEDAHLSGFSVDADRPVEGDLYAMGGSVMIGAKVGDDLSAMGFSVETDAEADVGGNARLMGGSVRIGGPVAGDLVASGGSVTLDAPVTGSVWIAAGSITFGEGARIGGQLTYSAPERIEVPASVISADRITYTELDTDTAHEVGESWKDWPKPGALQVLGTALLGILFFLALGAIWLAYAPDFVERLRRRAARRTGSVVLAGLAGLSMMFGAVPVLAMTLIGIPAVPFVILGIILAWTFGYLLGVYTLMIRLLDAFRGGEHTLWTRLAALAVGLAVAVLLNFIPVVGWLINLAFVLLGIGAMALALVEARTSKASV